MIDEGLSLAAVDTAVSQARLGEDLRDAVWLLAWGYPGRVGRRRAQRSLE
jgi:hypothetical protein